MDYSAFLSILILVALAYWFYSLVTPRPERMLYVYLVIYAFFPKAARVIYFAPAAEDWPAGITVYTVLELIAIIGVLITVLRKASYPPLPSTKAVRWMCGLLLATFVVGHAVPALLVQYDFDLFRGPIAVWRLVAATIEPQERWLRSSMLIYGAIVGLACTKHIRTRKQVETLFILGLASGVELLAEMLLSYWLNLVPGVGRWISSGGRFQSLSLNDYGMVGLWNLFVLAAGAYFVWSRRAYWTVPFLALVTFPLLFAFQRAPLLGLLAVVVYLAWMAAKQYRGIIACLALVVAATTMIQLGDSPELSLGITAPEEGVVRDNYLSTRSSVDRVALWLRACDAVLVLFPFGAGPGMLRYAMGFIMPETLRQFASDEVSIVYSRLASGHYVTNSHHIFVECLGEYGAVGGATMLFFVYLALKSHHRWKRSRESQATNGGALEASQCCTFALLLGLCTHGLFEAGTLPHAVHMILLWILFLPEAACDPAYGWQETPRKPQILSAG